MSLDTTGTILAIRRRSDNVALLPNYSAGDLTAALTTISAAKQFDIAVNGELMNLSDPQFRKYELTLSCGDVNARPSEAAQIGVQVQVDLAGEFNYPDGDAPLRSVVPGSSRSEDGFTFYQGRLDMTIIDYSDTENEWGAVIGWTMKFQED